MEILELPIRDVVEGDVITHREWGAPKTWAVFADDDSNVVRVLGGQLHWGRWPISVYKPEDRVRVRRAATPCRGRFPHVCPRCASPAYLGAVPAAFECSSAACR